MTFLAFLTFALIKAAFAANLNLTITGPSSLPDTASHVLHPSLASFSIETAFFISYVGNRTSPNLLTQNLLQNIKDRIGIPAEVRIGGITADSTFWDPTLEAAIFDFVDDSGALINTTIGPEFWNAARELLPADTQITVNLNLESLNYTGALAVAQSAVQGLSDQVAAFEIGNEPDHYLSFTPESYSDVWEPWSQNITSALNLTTPRFQLAATADDPLWPYNTPAADAQLDCVSALAAGVDNASTVEWCSEHTYQYSVCDPTRTAVATLSNLVNHTRLAMYLDLWQPRIQSVRNQLGSQAFVIGEFNSVSCSGRDGVSNTFGQALWLLDTAFYAASINVSRLYIHQGGPLALQSATQLNKGGFSFYDLWYPIDNLNGPVQVFPSYSAYLFVADTIGSSRALKIANIYPGRQSNGSTITTAEGDTSEGQLVVYGFWDESLPSNATFPTKLALLNLQIYNETQEDSRPVATFDISAFLSSADAQVTVRRLAAPGADTQSANVTLWAGQTFENGTPNGTLVEEKVSGGIVTVEASGAALVIL
ncbi:glycoside hydrolase family 79 protein [Lentinula raphanica]|uniref:Glycoside hydrolase family 79 protein n=1 Tax=Lentinula raphanica TaxID=153919 RepID=A0AA38UEG1_9AGAR|nr:glycoside hydrolase family 79 protein [Lentinula raphanica]KAJ3971248.1 glycoside hydrolase family 79 protein [Lentinula raphanica]